VAGSAHHAPGKARQETAAKVATVDSANSTLHCCVCGRLGNNLEGLLGGIDRDPSLEDLPHPKCVAPGFSILFYLHLLIKRPTKGWITTSYIKLLLQQ